MFNYLINWEKIVKENLPYFLHSLRRLNWIYSLIKPFKIIAEEFITLMQEFIDKIAYNGRVIYLEKILNDKFDPVGRGIYISDALRTGSHYIYQKIELKPPYYTYSKWNHSIAYLAGEFCVDGNGVYVALANNTNKAPSTNAEWKFHKPVEFVRSNADQVVRGFIVNIPTALVFDELRLRSLVNYYRLAGRNFTINLY